MIISFNWAVFNTEDANIQKLLAKILIYLAEEDHPTHILDETICPIFFDADDHWSLEQSSIQGYLSSHDIKSLKEYMSRPKPVTFLQKTYFRSITIGLDDSQGEISPDIAYKIIIERSLLFLENRVTDGSYIKEICKKYSYHHTRKGIYQLIERAITEVRLDLRNSGGVTAMPSQITAEINSSPYESIYRYKIMALLDGDQEYQEGSIKLNRRTEDSRCKIENLGIVWYQLHKRTIENYVPIDQILRIPNIEQDVRTAIGKMTPNDLDYYKYNDKPPTKAQVLNVFLEPFSYDKIEARCSHHRQSYSPPWFNTPPIEISEIPIEISEIEVILLKIAQIL